MDLYQQFPQSSLNFDPEFEKLLEIFTTRSISTIDILTTSPIELSNQLNISLSQIQKFISILKIQTNKQLGDDLIKGDDINQEVFTTGDLEFDKILNGGLRTGMITEIFGESSTAKSQFSMQLTKTINLSPDQGGLGGNSVYISTEGNLETKRLIEINPGIENVYYINCSDFETQEHILKVQLPLLLKDPEKNIRLVIIDSISHHLRVELLNSNYENFNKNQIILQNLGIYLNKLCTDFNISMILTNQISDKPDSNILNTNFKKISMDYQIGWLSGWSSQDIRNRQDNEFQLNSKIPTLGLNWSNLINVRILLKKNYKPGWENPQQQEQLEQEQEHGNWILKRYFKLVYSSISFNNDEVEFKVFKNGLFSVKN
ncbi:hypothetical protein BN7_5030 [Wickerhamomyces ciferrii]|uniref:RecA family profile 1 domain-containing protein n=1 Tax=Wickerhamomyces ciferrii (strain ATCC 14091 / BCRC 22168 / CBS 111 / JCM 3599 / NBRC 0793 / NRRL Y-1031 F-60-10) TaxID=1206466 RepID=K0KWB4_WICCF|nr:uncharacterized protein BN7_5030 [Wickerhamomyces ciferrii]CCH45448.1 hypothetical protein BN7_5030 [Wickerhamomyces ciferrii]